MEKWIQVVMRRAVNMMKPADIIKTAKTTNNKVLVPVTAKAPDELERLVPATTAPAPVVRPLLKTPTLETDIFVNPPG